MNTVQEKQHFYWLDAMRFIAAFMVLLSHARNTFFPAYCDLPADQHNIVTMAITMFCRMGHEAVIIFFILSGFLVGGRGFERIKNGTMNVKGYSIDRISRIYPPLIAAIAFYFITSLIIPDTPYSWSVAIGNLFNLQGIIFESLISPFWSLSYEVWFYVVFGSLAYALMSTKSRGKLIGFCFFALSVSVFTMGLKMHYLLVWMMGAVAYVIRPQKGNVLILIFSFIAFCVGVLLWQLSKDTNTLQVAISGTNKELLLIFISAMTCLFIQQIILFKPTQKANVFIEQALGKMARFSYTLYLSHRIVFLWIVAYVFPEASCSFSLIGIFKFGCIIIITLFACWSIYLISERYSPNIKRLLKESIINYSSHP